MCVDYLLSEWCVYEVMLQAIQAQRLIGGYLLSWWGGLKSVRASSVHLSSSFLSPVRCRTVSAHNTLWKGRTLLIDLFDRRHLWRQQDV